MKEKTYILKLDAADAAVVMVGLAQLTMMSNCWPVAKAAVTEVDFQLKEQGFDIEGELLRQTKLEQARHDKRDK